MSVTGFHPCFWQNASADSLLARHASIRFTHSDAFARRLTIAPTSDATSTTRRPSRQQRGPPSGYPANDCFKSCTSGSCCDGIDNDYDGKIDLQDEACACADGIDNDGDGFVDMDDWDCQRFADPD